MGLLLLAAACSGSTSITVAAASSFADLLDAVDEADCCGEFRSSLAGSNSVVAQVRAGAPIDVVGVADFTLLQGLIDDGLVLESPVAVTQNALVLVVAPGNPGAVESAADLGRDDVSVALADPAVPAGRYAREYLERVYVEVRAATLEANVRAVLTRVALGEVDAGIVYATDALASPAVEVIDLPDAGLDIRVGFGVVAGTAHEREAAAFVEALASAERAEMIGRAGFNQFQLCSQPAARC